MTSIFILLVFLTFLSQFRHRDAFAFADELSSLSILSPRSTASSVDLPQFDCLLTGIKRDRINVNSVSSLAGSEG